MTPPAPTTPQPEEIPALARQVMAEARFPMLATMDGEQPRLRPVSPVKVEGFTVYIANLRTYGKTAEIAANPRVELCYLNADHDQVRITGRAEIVTDPGVIGGIWQANPLLRRYLGTADNPALIIYRIDPQRVRYMKEWALEYQEVTVG